ncbi:nucleolar and spindle-associated protein 1 isoform X2 [Cyclopterus lumpus]|uniref:nucleolar and spindle-associated protein 1 isoform X2 n=1 Tax=Cyclopterus lumpus TaxID=8103 RepID=UPI001486F569|nr:nucleolar and spindle-associated protein 1 isoform X2 [Cyclopterus lumpus]
MASPVDVVVKPDWRNISLQIGTIDRPRPRRLLEADKLLKVIRQHYQRETDTQEERQAQENDVTAVQGDETVTEGGAQGNQDVFGPAVFVNTRRGRNGTKRKISDPAPATGCDARSPPSATEGDTEVAASSPPSGAQGAKKRKVSSTKDSDKSKTEPPQEAAGSEQSDIKDEAPVQSNTEKAPRVARAGKIPRYQGHQQKNKLLLNPVTPNFKKLHEAHFNKMESIDTYVQRKTKQMETSRSSVKKPKRLSAKTKPQQVEGKAQGKANQSLASMFSPVPVAKRPAEDRRTLPSASKAPPAKPAAKEDAPFRPSVLSSRRVNVRFTEATRDNASQKSLVKTPARMSLGVTSSTPKRQAAGGGKPKNVKISTCSATKTPAFVFTGNTSTSTSPGTQKKSGFDLKESLSRPLTYKPHAGKLKPFGDNQENTAANKSLISNSHQKNYKQHQVQTRGARRAKHVEDRKQKKESMLGARRGLVML